MVERSPRRKEQYCNPEDSETGFFLFFISEPCTTKFVFTASDFRKFGKALGVKGKARGNNVASRWRTGARKRKLAV